MTGGKSNLNTFMDALDSLKRELKSLGAEDKIKEFGLDSWYEKNVQELYDEWFVTKADGHERIYGLDVRGRQNPSSFLHRKYEKELKVLREKKWDEDTRNEYVTEYGLTPDEAYDLNEILKRKTRSFEDEYQRIFQNYIKHHGKPKPKPKSKEK